MPYKVISLKKNYNVLIYTTLCGSRVYSLKAYIHKNTMFKLWTLQIELHWTPNSVQKHNKNFEPVEKEVISVSY